MYLDSLINDHFPAYVTGPRFVNPIFYSLATFVLSVCMGWLVCRGRYLQAFRFRKTGLALCRGGTCKRFLSEERVSRSAFLFTLVLRLNANRNYKFPRIVDTKFPKLIGC